MMLQCRLKTDWKISKPYCITLQQLLGSFASKVMICTTNIRNDLLEMGKGLKTKHSVSSLPYTPPYKVWGNFFHNKALHGGTNVFGQFFFGGIFYMGTNDQIMQGGS